MNTSLKGNNGYVLPGVIVLIVFSILMGMAVLHLGSIERISARRRGVREGAFYLAEAGVERAMAHLRLNEDWQPEQNPLPLGGGTFAVTRQNEGNLVHLSSTGLLGATDEQVQVTLKFAHVWSEGIFARDAVVLANGATIASYDSSEWFFSHGDEGHTGSLVRIENANQATLKGNASVAPGGAIIRPERVDGSVNENTRFPETLTDMPDVAIPQDLLDLDYLADGDPAFEKLADTGNITLDGNGNLTVAGNAHVRLGAGSYRFKTITVSGTARLTFDDETQLYVEERLLMNGTPRWQMQGATTLYLGAASTMELKGNTEILHEITTKEGETIQSSDPRDFRIYSASTLDPAIQLGNAPDKAGVVGSVGLIYAPDGVVDLANNTDFYGAITARQILVGNNSNLYYDKNLMFTDLDAPGHLEIVRWTKPSWTREF